MRDPAAGSLRFKCACAQALLGHKIKVTASHNLNCLFIIVGSHEI
jgi:hypothetical protein